MIESFQNNKWNISKIITISIVDKELIYTIMYENGKTENVKIESLRKIKTKKENFPDVIKKIKTQIKFAISENDVDKAYKLGKLLKQLT